MFAPTASPAPLVVDPSQTRRSALVRSQPALPACVGRSAAGAGRLTPRMDGVLEPAAPPDANPLHDLASALDAVLWLYEPHAARFVYVSPAYEAEWMGDAQALYADAQNWLRAVRADDEPLLRACFAGLSRGEGYELEYCRMLPADGRRWIAEKVLPVPGHAWPWPRFAGISRDITGHQREHLDVLRSSRAQREFMAVLSHELRHPLQALRSASDLLSLCGTLRPGAGHNALSVIDRQVAQIARLVDDLLDVSRIDTGKLCLKPTATRIDEVLESAVAASQFLIDAKRLRVHYTGVPGPAWVHGDAARLTQVFSNLLHNAAKFSFAGGRIDIGILPAPDRGQVQISIRDEGAGIEPDLIPSVFDLYVQQAGRSSRDEGGLGIGLSVVRGLVELHGGSVSVHSDGVGRGSEFTVTLPSADIP